MFTKLAFFSADPKYDVPGRLATRAPGTPRFFRFYTLRSRLSRPRAVRGPLVSRKKAMNVMNADTFERGGLIAYFGSSPRRAGFSHDNVGNVIL